MFMKVVELSWALTIDRVFQTQTNGAPKIKIHDSMVLMDSFTAPYEQARAIAIESKMQIARVIESVAIAIITRSFYSSSSS